MGGVVSGAGRIDRVAIWQGEVARVLFTCVCDDVEAGARGRGVEKRFAESGLQQPPAVCSMCVELSPAVPSTSATPRTQLQVQCVFA